MRNYDAEAVAKREAGYFIEDNMYLAEDMTREEFADMIEDKVFQEFEVIGTYNCKLMLDEMNVDIFDLMNELEDEYGYEVKIRSWEDAVAYYVPLYIVGSGVIHELIEDIDDDRFAKEDDE